MAVLNWDKPKKVKTTQEWKNDYGFDGGPDGGYQSNMSEDDKLSWKAKITGTKLGYPQVEIRKTTGRGSQVVIIVNLGNGYNYKYYRAEDEKYADRNDYFQKYGPNSRFGYNTEAETEAAWQRNAFPTKGVNVHIATNGPIQMTFDEMLQLQQAVEEAKEVLGAL